jgi:hypothetical protein
MGIGKAAWITYPLGGQQDPGARSLARLRRFAGCQSSVEPFQFGAEHRLQRHGGRQVVVLEHEHAGLRGGIG